MVQTKLERKKANKKYIDAVEFGYILMVEQTLFVNRMQGNHMRSMVIFFLDLFYLKG